MSKLSSFALLLLSSIAIAQHPMYYPQNMAQWFNHMAPLYYPNHEQYYDSYHGRQGYNPTFDMRDRYLPNYRPAMQEETQGRNRQQVFNTDSQAAQMVDTRSVMNAAQEQDQQGVSTPDARFFLGSATIGTAATANYLIKTSYVLVTSTGTLCFKTSCIPASLFKADSSNIICARRKRVAELMTGEVDTDDGSDIIPSDVLEVMQTASLTLGDIKFDAKPAEEKSSSPITLRSSQIEEPQDSPRIGEASDADVVENQHERKKRFLFLLTTTITTYSFASTTYTSTLLPAETSTLTCRPSGIALC